MKRNRPEKTIVDYLAAAVAPLLIIVLVESLVLYLLEVGYSGPSEGRLRWTLFWFVLATVLVSRIALEIGSEHAALYGIALALVTAIAIMQYVRGPWPILGLLALIWWLASRLVRNCTVLESEGAKQTDADEGILSFLSSSSEGAAAEATPQRRPWIRGSAAQTNRSTRPRKEVGPWLKALREMDRPHLPGASVIYFSLIALPLFGLGELWLQGGSPSQREAAFHFIWLYVASGIGLLLITSFLSLRRYLRHRHVPIPDGMAGTWVTIGGGTALLVLLLALVLPRPEPVYSIATLTEKVAQSEEKKSGRDGDGKASETGKSRNRKGERKQAGKEGAKASKSAKQGEKSKDLERSDRGKTEGGAAEKAQDGSRGQSQKGQGTAGKVGKLIQWLLYLVLGLIALVWLWKHRKQVMNGLRGLMADLRQLFSKLRWARRASTVAEEAAGRQSAPRMEVLQDPFATGHASSWSPEELLRYSFDALQAWGYEHGFPRKQQQTPNEFASALSREFPSLRNDAVMVADLYSQWAYGGKPPSRHSTELLRQFWRSLEAANGVRADH